MNIQKNISNRLKMFQAKTGLNTMECAKALGISKSSLQDYKDGKRLPRADTLELIADSMGISVADLISDCDNPIQDAFSDAWQNLHPLLRPVQKHRFKSWSVCPMKFMHSSSGLQKRGVKMVLISIRSSAQKTRRDLVSLMACSSRNGVGMLGTLWRLSRLSRRIAPLFLI